MTSLLRNACVLREIAAPTGWTAALLEADLPLARVDHARYTAAVAELRHELATALEAPHRELFLLFERCRPGVEIPLMQQNARWWMPEIGMGVWLDRNSPATWSAEEFAAAAPGTLRPVIDRVFRLSREPQPQESAWRSLAGSGALLSVSSTAPARFLEEATAFLHPRISDPSLTSFPFYVPLLTAEAIAAPSAAFDAPLHDLLPQTEAYLRESVEDGGLLIVVRREPAAFWNDLSRRPLTSLDLQRHSRLTDS